MAVKPRGNIWHYSFCIRGVRYRKSVPEARTKYQALQAEAKTKEAVFSGRYGSDPSNITLKNFIEKQYLTWAKDNKRSWQVDESRAKAILEYFKNKMMRELTRFNIEQFKKTRLTSFNGRGSLRAPASVDRELELLSRIFSLAIERGLIQTNPCKGVKKLRVPNLVERYLTVEEEERLIAVLQEKHPQLFDILTIALHTGTRNAEVRTLHKSQIDFFRDCSSYSR